MIGFICTMKILLVNMENFIRIIDQPLVHRKKQYETISRDLGFDSVHKKKKLWRR